MTIIIIPILCITTDTNTVFINAATCNFDQLPSNRPIIFDMPNKK